MHELYMAEALKEAGKAKALQEVPIGCVIVYKDQIIGRGHNRRNTDRNPLAHAEIMAINEASGWMKDWRLEECTLYVTLEPCPMCAGAIVQSRIPLTVIGAANLKAGSAGTIIDVLRVPAFNHQVEVINGVLEEECGLILKAFFKEMRTREREEKARRKAREMQEEGALLAETRT